MENILDDYAHRNALRDVDTRLKLALGVGAILIGIFSTTPISPLIIGLSMGIITVGIARIPLRLYVGLLAIPISFAAMSGIVILFMTGGGEPLWTLTVSGFSFSMTTESLNLAVLVTCRTFGGMSSLFFIALTTPAVELFSVMRDLRLPKEFVDLSMLIYRYIFVLIGEAIAMHNAQVMRNGYSGFRRSIHAFSMLGAMLFIKAWERGEALLVAMDARCYDGKLEVMEGERHLDLKGVASVGCYLCLCSVITVLFAGKNIF